MDWPADKLRVHILDDGQREAFREFAAEVGVGYIIRPDNRHAKAGNLNHALAQTNGEFIAIFDCDHIPTRSFLQLTMGGFLRDQKLAIVQTPHHFFSPDPFERNLGTFRSVPNEGELFYGVIQDGNDLWNATFFCGSCAVIRRAPLEEVGGIAVETVTEDAHTALKLQRRGYNSAYINVPQAAGLATESLSAHIGQRIRWARGMAQIFRIDNPFLGKGLNWAQRICYGNAMLHFLNGGPRLVFLTAPLAFLFFHAYVIYAPAISVVLYVLPHMIHANLASSRIQGNHRHSFWAEVYETVLAWYLVRPTMVALINPDKGTFNVTVKGGLVDKDYFDWTISLPDLALVVLSLIGVAAGVTRIVWGPSDEIPTVLINLIWTAYNILVLGGAIAVAAEARQVRVSHRVRMRLPAILHLPNGKLIHCETADFSEGGISLSVP
jgi:cellulose synthase (UDP-forming)